MQSKAPNVFMHSFLRYGFMLFLAMLFSLAISINLFVDSTAYAYKRKYGISNLMSFLNLILYFYCISKLVRTYLDYRILSSHGDWGVLFHFEFHIGIGFGLLWGRSSFVEVWAQHLICTDHSDNSKAMYQQYKWKILLGFMKRQKHLFLTQLCSTGSR